TEGARKKRSILSTMRVGTGFGHDYRSDRVDNLVLSFDTWNKLAGHCSVQDLGAFDKHDSSMISLGDAGEFFILRPMVQGIEYYKDLDRILLSSGNLESYDLPRARALAKYLVSIHSKKKKKGGIEAKELYARKIRDTVGHGECIFGIADSYPQGENLEYLKEGELEQIEKKCVEHRWRLKGNFTRLSQVHGDFHPWNILFSGNPKKNPERFSLLDRSRGEWGEPADDVCALSINYVFYSLRKYGDLRNEFRLLFEEFMNTYLRGSKDPGILNTLPLFYAFRALVIASPVWYPTIPVKLRRKVFNFTRRILDEEKFEPSQVNQYLGDL
ncbi:MAG: aminoglycoside phosphotransferase family protein, partial [Nitrososphaerales archaeon]